MIKRLIKDFFFGNRKPEQEAGISKFIKNGNLVIGKNVKLDNCKITFKDPQQGVVNITIGDDTIIEGQILIHNKNASVNIGSRVFVGANTLLFCYNEIKIGDDVMFSWDCTVIDTNAHSLNFEERKNDVLDWARGPQFKDWSHVESKKIVIENKCWIGFKSIIMKGVELGEGCIVAAGSVVTKKFDSFSVVGGNPATVIKSAS
jgi:galactoside O-acetyltransferase